jgi:hypothetical protein
MSDLDPVVAALIARLPAIGGTWPTVARRRWLRALESTFDLIYFENDATPTIEIVLSDDGPEEELPTLVHAEPEEPEELAKVEEPEPPIVPLSKPRAPANPPRPAGTPSIFEMVRTILTERPGLTSREVHAAIVERWWPTMSRERLGPDISTAVKDKKINRDQDGKLWMTLLGNSMEVRPPRARGEAPPRRVYDTPLSPPAHKIQGVASVLATNEKLVPFIHGDKTAMLTKSELEMAEALRRAMGKGFMDYAFLGLRGRGAGQSRAVMPDKTWLSYAIPVLAEKLKPLGFEIVHTNNFGYVMKEQEA